jgi:hypothetical protein
VHKGFGEVCEYRFAAGRLDSTDSQGHLREKVNLM